MLVRRADIVGVEASVFVACVIVRWAMNIDMIFQFNRYPLVSGMRGSGDGTPSLPLD